MIDRASFALANLMARRSGKSLATRPKVASWRRFASAFDLRVDPFADQTSHRRALSRAVLTVKLATMPSARRVGFFACIG
jgi:hypothetical protein